MYLLAAALWTMSAVSAVGSKSGFHSLTFFVGKKQLFSQLKDFFLTWLLITKKCFFRGGFELIFNGLKCFFYFFITDLGKIDMEIQTLNNSLEFRYQSLVGLHVFWYLAIVYNFFLQKKEFTITIIIFMWNQKICRWIKLKSINTVKAPHPITDDQDVQWYVSFNHFKMILVI